MTRLWIRMELWFWTHLPFRWGSRRALYWWLHGLAIDFGVPESVVDDAWLHQDKRARRDTREEA